MRTISEPVACSNCNGTGVRGPAWENVKCKVCTGTGVVIRTITETPDRPLCDGHTLIGPGQYGCTNGPLHGSIAMRLAGGDGYVGRTGSMG